MNKEQTKALILYCKLTFGHGDISVNECLACIDEDARDLGLTRMQYFDYIVVNGKLPVWVAGLTKTAVAKDIKSKAVDIKPKNNVMIWSIIIYKYDSIYYI